MASLNRGLKYRHWADFTNYTHPFELAVGCVFVKQSDPPSHCALHPHLCKYGSRNPFFQRYGTILPNSLDWIMPTRLGLLTQGHLCWFLVRTARILALFLFTDSRLQFNSPTGTHQHFIPLLDITSLRGIICLDNPCGIVNLARSVKKTPFVADIVSDRYRNINLFPFPEAPVRTSVRID